ncbi:hypothetical protein BDZ89DRAFT_620618 [Hymenopellis radicata]|nr:hypothetical protein BDZ89DRAFT_620618 [Hymenopellis radicata]
MLHGPPPAESSVNRSCRYRKSTPAPSRHENKHLASQPTSSRSDTPPQEAHLAWRALRELDVHSCFKLMMKVGREMLTPRPTGESYGLTERVT